MWPGRSVYAWPGERGRGEVVALAGPALVVLTGLVCVVAWSIDPSGAIDDAWRWPLAGTVAVLAAVLLASRRHPGPARHAAAAMASSALITLAIVATGEAGDRASVLSVPVAVYAAYVLPRSLAVAIVALIGVGLAAALHASDVETPLLAWSLTMATVGSAAYAVRVLRRRVRHLLSELGEDARRDHLTGVLNRRGIDERLADEVRRARRTHEPLSVLVGDLDRFKELNDLRGHAEGDRALRAVAGALLSATRSTDVVGRLGGDEFIVMLPATDAAGATESEGRIAAALDELAESVRVTFGAATFPSGADSAGRLVAVADERLIVRKRTGRPARLGR